MLTVPRGDLGQVPCHRALGCPVRVEVGVIQTRVTGIFTGMPRSVNGDLPGLQHAVGKHMLHDVSRIFAFGGGRYWTTPWCLCFDDSHIGPREWDVKGLSSGVGKSFTVKGGRIGGGSRPRTCNYSRPIFAAHNIWACVCPGRGVHFPSEHLTFLGSFLFYLHFFFFTVPPKKGPPRKKGGPWSRPQRMPTQVSWAANITHKQYPGAAPLPPRACPCHPTLSPHIHQ